MREDFPSWTAKVDHHLRALFERSRDKPDEARQLVRVFVRVTENADVESLRAVGLQLGSVAGNIATASLILSDVPTVASAPDILFIEMSQPLGLDSATQAHHAGLDLDDAD